MKDINFNHKKIKDIFKIKYLRPIVLSSIISSVSPMETPNHQAPENNNLPIVNHNHSVTSGIKSLENYLIPAKRQKVATYNINTQYNKNYGFQFQILSDVFKIEILKKISIFNIKKLDNVNPIKLVKLVSKDWYNIVNQYKDFANQVVISAYNLSANELEDYKRFLKGVLIYSPNGDTDNEPIYLPISDLPNPLEGAFDLSQCGDADKYLCISTGYRKQKKAENSDKVEIWVTPRFLVEKELSKSANHFKDIFPVEWQNDAPVGITWSYGDDDTNDDYYYLTDKSTDMLSKNNLYNNLRDQACYHSSFRAHDFGIKVVASRQPNFHVHFNFTSSTT